MTKSMHRATIAIAVCLTIAASASASKNLSSTHAPLAPRTGQKLTLEIMGAEGPQAAAELQRAFAASGIQATVRQNKKRNKPLKLEAQVDQNTDLSVWSRSVAAAVPNRVGQLPVALDLVIYATLKPSRTAQVMAQLERVKGVDARYSTIDVKKGVLRVRISGADPVTAQDIANAVKQAGVVSHFAKTTRTKRF
jgi:hypothetical protein